MLLCFFTSIDFAGRQRRDDGKYAAPAGAITKGFCLLVRLLLTKLLHAWRQESAKINEPRQEQVLVVRSRILKIKTNDYGSYDPSPSLSKPPFKLIPN
ncbi:hypothetical protein BHE74_00006835 [Ensete ventricosum]|nr:hypothetical protein BHE74_00006835 [Ensete ventricosum]RZS00630.1 hypothetical protein BHM03_00030363 [Ensete ventricosum]